MAGSAGKEMTATGMMMLQREMEEKAFRVRRMEMRQREELEARRRYEMEMMRRFEFGRPGEMIRIADRFNPDGGMFGPMPWEQGEDLSAAPKSEPDRKALPRFGVALADDGETDVQLAKEAESLLGYNVLRRKLKIPGKLGEVLACLEIEPLDTAAVEKYKADMVLWRKKEVFGKHATDPNFNHRYRIDVSWRRVLLGDCPSEVPLFALRKAVQVKKACPEATLEVDELIEQKKLIDPFLVATLDDELYYLEVWKEPKFEENL
jgi:hypothetical protein